MAPLYLQLIEAFEAGQIDEACRLQRISMEVIHLLVGTGNFFAAMKAVLNMQGVCMSSVGASRKKVEPTTLVGLKDRLASLGFWDIANVPNP